MATRDSQPFDKTLQKLTCAEHEIKAPTAIVNAVMPDMLEQFEERMG